MNRRYFVAMVSLAVLALVFGLVGTVAPPLAEGTAPKPQQEYSSSSSSDSAAHFQNPPSYDSGWVNITDKAGQYATLTHSLNTTDVVVDITGKQNLEPMSGSLAWDRNYGGTGTEYGYSLIQTSDGGYALAGSSNSPGTAGVADFWLVKTDALGNKLWSGFYGGANFDECMSVIQTDDCGYALAGYSNSPGTAGFYDFWLVKTDALGNKLWDKFYGGGSNDQCFSVVQTSGGGYVLVGASGSAGTHGGYDFWLVKTDESGNKESDWFYGGAGQDYAYSLVQLDSGEYILAGSSTSIGSHGFYDFWLVKTDASGNKLWDMFYGGTDIDVAYSVIQTDDCGYALAGYSDSPGTAGGSDFWLVRADPDGNKLWDKFYGGTGTDRAFSLVEDGDREFVLAGYSDSSGTVGFYDAWLVKSNATGSMLWNKKYGGRNYDYAHSVVLTGDYGYAFGGDTNSYGISGNSWLAKVNGDRNREHQRNFGEGSVISGWSRIYGGSSNDMFWDMIQTSDGGYALAGSSNSPGTAGDFDFWLVKTDPTGYKLWDKFYGGTGSDFAHSLIQTSDGGYALIGVSNSPGTTGDNDFWLVKTDPDGYKLWDKFYGGTKLDVGRSIVQADDDGYAILGYSNSSGTFSYYDFWLVKTDSAGVQQWAKPYERNGNEMGYSIVKTFDGGYALAGNTRLVGEYENIWLVKTDSIGAMQWNGVYGGAGMDFCVSAVQTFDGGYALAGSTDSDSYGVAGLDDFWLVKTDASGDAQWNKTFGGPSSDYCYSAVQTLDGGYALAGVTASFGAGGQDFWLVKTDASGNMQWSRTYGGTANEMRSMVITADEAYALAGMTESYGVGGDGYLVKTDIENGLAWTGSTNCTITLYRGKTDLYWNYVRVRMWLIKEPSWIYGDVNMDGVVDAQDLYILSRNYGKTFSLLSLTGIIAIASVHTYKSKRKQSKRSSCIS